MKFCQKKTRNLLVYEQDEESLNQRVVISKIEKELNDSDYIIWCIFDMAENYL